MDEAENGGDQDGAGMGIGIASKLGLYLIGTAGNECICALTYPLCEEPDTGGVCLSVCFSRPFPWGDHSLTQGGATSNSELQFKIRAISAAMSRVSRQQQVSVRDAAFSHQEAALPFAARQLR